MQDLQGTLVWLDGIKAHNGLGDSCSQRVQDMHQLYQVSEVSDDSLMLAPVFQCAGDPGGTRILRRADAVKLQLAQADDLCVLILIMPHSTHISARTNESNLGNRHGQTMFIWLVSRLQNQDSKWAIPTSRRAHVAKLRHDPEQSAARESPRPLRDGLAKVQHPRAIDPACKNDSKHALACASNGQPVHRAGTGVSHAERADGAKPIAVQAAAQGIESLKRTKSAAKAVAGAVPQRNTVPCITSHVKPSRAPQRPFIAAKTEPSAKRRRIHADSKRLRDKIAKVHERKEQQKQSFLNLPQATTDAMDLPHLRHAARQ